MADTAGADAGANDALVATDAPDRGPSDEEKHAMALASAQRKVEKARQHLADAEAYLANVEAGISEVAGAETYYRDNGALAEEG